MDSGEWRHGQAEPERSWSAYAHQSPGDPPNLWVDDPMVAWGSSDTWVPQQRTGDDRRRDSSAQPPVGLEPDAWYRPATPPPHDPPGNAHPEPRHDRRGDLTEARTGAVRTSHAAATDPWPGRIQTSQVERRPATREPTKRWPQDSFDDPAYGPVLGFTAAWYGAPGVLYLIWLLTLSGDRQGLVGRNFLAGLPWLAAAVVLSLAVAALLRWAVQGWRALTISFAAAVIGAGVATIAHTLAA
ncbi:MAG: hypothetical protein ACM30G_20690 [Micromonosporaceae bacterium]